MIMSLTLFVCLSLMSLINITLHTIGFFLLLTTKEIEEEFHMLLITHLCASEIFGSVCWFLIDTLAAVSICTTHGATTIAAVQEYLSFLTSTTFLLVYYMLMMCIVLDKLSQIKLHLKYPLYVQRVKNKLLASIWFIGLVFCVIITLLNKVEGIEYEEAFVKYVYPVFDVTVLLVIIVCYTYIFYKFTELKRTPKYTGSSNISRFKILFKSRFYITLLIVLTFLGLVVIPDLVYLIHLLQVGVIYIPHPTLLVLYHFSFTSDAVIYIFLHSSVQRKFINVFHRYTRKCSVYQREDIV